MLTFKKFIKEINDNPDKEALSSQIRKSIKTINKQGVTPDETSFHIKKIKAMKELQNKK